MSAAAPTFSQIKAQVTAIREKVPRADIIGIQSTGRWSGEPLQRDGDHAYAIYQCDSPLAMRFALREPVDERTTKVLITAVEEKSLSDDILLRLAKRQLFPIKPWQIVRNLFNAHAVDPRLSSLPWIAEMLLELVPAEGYPPARGGFLDAETIWPLLLHRTVGLNAEARDLTELLKWSLDAEGLHRFQLSSEQFREGAIAWLTAQAGLAAEVVLRSLVVLERPDAVAIGLAAGVVFHPQASGRLERATARLEERYLAGQSPDAELMQRWSSAATEVVRAVRKIDGRQYRQLLSRTDEILREIQADGFAYLSHVSQLGFDQRMARFGQQLTTVLEQRPQELPTDLQVAYDVIRQHDLTTEGEPRLERVVMALRLLRWLQHRRHEPRDAAQSFSAAADEQLREGGYVDWARFCLWRGEPVAELSTAYSRLFEEVRALREQDSATFARLLADWTATGSTGDDVLPVERILERVVAPLAAEQLVLVVVIDGMSVAVCRELMQHLAGHDWSPICEPGRDYNRPGLATIPSVTTFSRTSLLCGELREGQSPHEANGFAEHAALLALCRSGSPPLLFHKAGLQGAEDTDLAKDVRSAIQSTHRRVVGVVINAVDDHLLKGDQIDIRWSRDRIKFLPALLHEARVARRLVVLVSDHGHVLDCNTTQHPGDAGERYRTAVGEPGEGELLVTGNRVLGGNHRVIVPWSERIRYGMKKNGYHGGITPQEMIVPIVVLASTDDLPTGWHEQPVDTPSWWDETTQTPVPQRAPQLKPAPQAPDKPKSGMLFDLEAQDETVQQDLPHDDMVQVAWIVRLLASPIFADQKRLGGRGIPADSVFRELLSQLDQRGGKMTSVALARSLQFPALRLPGLLAKAERVLNVDGYDILRRDAASDTIELNRELLLMQFDLVE